MARFYRRGRKWWADFREGGKRQRVSLGTDDLEGARTVFSILYSEDPPRRPPRPSREEIAKRLKAQSVAEAARAWLRHVEIEHEHRPDTVATYRAYARRWERRWGHLPMSRLDRGELQEWRAERLGEVSRRTVSNDRGVMRSFLSWCVREGILAAAPAIDAVRGVPKKRERPAALSDEEVATLVRVAREHPLPQVRQLESVVRVGVGTGLRRAELCALEWGDVDLAERFLVVRARGRFTPKGGEAREVALGPSLHEYLVELRASRPGARWICETCERGQWRVAALTKWARRLWIDAGLHDERAPVLHALRHTYGTNLVARGADLETVRQLMGHSSVTTSELYFHSTRKRKREAVEGL